MKRNKNNNSLLHSFNIFNIFNINKKGFSIIEVVVSLIIFTLGVGFTFSGIIIYNSSFNKLNEEINITNSINIIVNRISIDNNYIPTLLEFNIDHNDPEYNGNTIYVDSSNTLVLEENIDNSITYVYSFNYKEEISTNPINENNDLDYTYTYSVKKITISSITSLRESNAKVEDIILSYVSY